VRRALPLGGLFFVASLAAYAVAAQPAGHRARAYLAVHFALLALMLAGWRLLRGARAVRVAVLVGLAARLALVGVDTVTTTDVTRYLWDGAVALAGHDPYALPPLAVELTALRATVPFPVDHRDVATCYPPAALGLFALAALAGSHAWVTWKLLVAAASMLTVWLVWRHLRDGDRPHDAVLAAWSPVLVLESGVGAHLDVFTALALVAAAVLCARRRTNAAALAAGVGVAVKLLPAVAVIALARRARSPLRFVTLAMAPLALSLLAAEIMGFTAPGSLPLVAENWSFAAPAWTLLYDLFADEYAAIRVGLALAMLLGVLVASLRADATRAVRDALTVQLAANPVAYPWYGAGLAAVSALAPGWLGLAMLSVIPCSYEVLDGYQLRGAWEPAWWPVALNAGALVGGLGAEMHAGWQRAKRG
jgi:alpha-1,6-mannosyltransferase